MLKLISKTVQNIYKDDDGDNNGYTFIKLI